MKWVVRTPLDMYIEREMGYGNTKDIGKWVVLELHKQVYVGERVGDSVGGWCVHPQTPFL